MISFDEFKQMVFKKGAQTPNGDLITTNITQSA